MQQTLNTQPLILFNELLMLNPAVKSEVMHNSVFCRQHSSDSQPPQQLPGRMLNHYEKKINFFVCALSNR